MSDPRPTPHLPILKELGYINVETAIAFFAVTIHDERGRFVPTLTLMPSSLNATDQENREFNQHLDGIGRIIARVCQRDLADEAHGTGGQP